ncbi:MAG TPA: glycosyltransferase family 4 protein [Patescibacteria group bacterium]|nr:glycosyltransferase family 4 protein [Patescibacteria group bacterium]
MKQPKIAIMAKSVLIGYGVDEIVNFLATELSQSGFDVTVLVNKSEYPKHKYKTILYNLATIPFLNEFWNSNFLIDLRSFFAVTSVLSAYDMIITVDPMHIVGALARGLFRKKVIMYYFGVPPPKVLDSFVRKIESVRESLLWNLSFYFSNRLVTNSYYTKNLVSQLLKNKAGVNYHGIDHLISKEKEKAAKFRDDLGVGDRKLILSIGRFSTPYKGMAEVVRLFNGLEEERQDAILLLVGRGSISDLGMRSPPENVRILSNVPFDTLRICFEACDVYCTCSKWEGFNLPMVAAMANGKPVVAYNVGAHSEILANEETGFLVESSVEFQHRLRLLMEDGALRERMGQKARVAARKFTWEESARNFQKTICQVFSES